MYSLKHYKGANPRALALINGGKLDGKTVYFYEDPKKIETKTPELFTNLELYDGTFIQLPNTDKKQRDIFIIAGGSGLGKSTLSGLLMQQYRLIFPKRPIYIFSKVSEDPSIDDLKIPNVKRILLDDTFLEGEPLDKTDFKESLTLFDDIDTLSGELLKAVQELRNDLMATARHSQTHMIITFHLLMAYKTTRLALLEGTSFTIFPRANTYQTSRFLRTYCGFTTKQIKNFCNLPSRHVTLIKTFPYTVLTSNSIMLASELEPPVN